ncbi:hypothetical protein HanIR_Chr15g0747931 [Helianthus annuus]|nr:hypothetical protein HanIR_Chr15g0747931 [Helianthus annuus]
MLQAFTEMAQYLSREATRSKRNTTYSNPRMQLILIWVILIATHLPPSSAVHRHHDSLPFGGKAVFFKTASPQLHATAPSRQRQAGEEDKRLVHTGPNPLHN